MLHGFTGGGSPPGRVPLGQIPFEWVFSLNPLCDNKFLNVIGNSRSLNIYCQLRALETRPEAGGPVGAKLANLVYAKSGEPMDGVPVFVDHALTTGLREHPFTRDLSPFHLEELAGCSRECTIAAGEYLWRQGGPADFFYLISKGRAALEISIPHEGVLRLENLAEGEVLGWYWLLPTARWNVDARAVTNLHALRVDGKNLQDQCEKDPSLRCALLEKFSVLVAQRLLNVQARLVHAVS